MEEAVRVLLQIQIPFSLTLRDSKPIVLSLVPKAGVLCPVRREPSCCFRHSLMEILQSKVQSSRWLFAWI